MMNENSKSNIIQILNSLDTLVQILEDSTWVKLAQIEDIKTAFKLGNFIEKTIDNFTTESLNEFMDVLNKWWKTKNRTKIYDSKYYQFACDNLLIKFFRYETVSETSLDIAVRIYTSLFPKERMQKVISELILSSNNMNVLYDFLNICMSKENRSIIEYQLKLKYWSDLLETGNNDTVINEIKDLLSLYKIETALYLLIGILSIQDTVCSEKQVQIMILQHIQEKMLDRTLISKHFWITLFKEIDVNVICKTCKNFQEFLISFFNFIMYLGSMMIKKDDVWMSDSNISVCPEITYYDIIKHIKFLYTSSDNKMFIISKLTEAKEYSDSDIWDQIKIDVESV